MKPVTIPFGPEERARMAEQWNAHPGMRHTGARADFSDPDQVQVVIEHLEPYHRGGMGTTAINGAVLAGLFDVAIGIVGQFHTAGRRAGSVQLSIQFIRPLNGNSVRVRARLVRAGTSLIFGTAEAFDERDVVCARAEGIVAAAGTGGSGGDKPL